MNAAWIAYGVLAWAGLVAPGVALLLGRTIRYRDQQTPVDTNGAQR